MIEQNIINGAVEKLFSDFPPLYVKVMRVDIDRIPIWGFKIKKK